ncbi:MAG: DNA replication/repair protein RecF [Bacteroidales bacterium]|nr:DNA replication/repair protein RecF [Bacteroidales bacterium]MBR4716295.1 DNA replication/repair protein RecF [Bacteroidales bacterium]
MYIDRLLLANFKNYIYLDVSFSNNVNCLVGNNGVGKTNLLDALYYLSFCKSYFNPVDSQNIRMGADYFAINGQYVLDDEGGDPVTVACTLQRGQSKKMKFNKKQCSTFAEHIGRLPLVIVTPSDQNLILGGSDARRKFVDGIMSQVDKNYLQLLLGYQKALEQRNRLLKQFYDDNYFDEASIAVWDEQLVRYGEPIVEERRRFLNDFMPLFEQYYVLIHPNAPNGEKPSIEYVTQLAEGGQGLEGQLVDARRRDAQMQYTTVGPHKDDFEFGIGEFSVKRFGSQGQQKTFLLALKLAQFEYVRMHLGTKPILLLDDVFDKLDMQRVSQLVLLVGSDRFGQVFITDTQPGRVESIFKQAPDMPHKIFTVENGELRTENGERRTENGIV